MYQNKVLNYQSSSPSVSWKLNTSLTQKDTMDRGARIKIQKERHAGGLKKDKKVQKHKRCKMAWEWGTNEYLCLPYVTILWCPSWKLPEDRGKKMKLIFLASRELYWLGNIGFHSPKLDYHQWLKVHIFSIWEIQTSRRIQHVGFIVKQSVT